MERIVTGTDMEIEGLTGLLSFVQEEIDAIEETLDDDPDGLDVQYWSGAAASLYLVEKRIRGRIATLKGQE